MFGELSSHFEEGEISSEELLFAAQKLIELSRREYVTKKHKDQKQRPNYFVHEVDVALETKSAAIVKTEWRSWRDRELSPAGRTRLTDILKGSKKDMYLDFLDD